MHSKAGFIATLFVALIILNRRRANPKAIKALSFICLLLVFEFITFIIHPYVDKLTHHEPIYMVLILASVAGLLGRLHHRLEHWLIEKLTGKKHQPHHDEPRSASNEMIQEKELLESKETFSEPVAHKLSTTSSLPANRKNVKKEEKKELPPKPVDKK